MKWLRNVLLALLRAAVRAELVDQRATETAHVTELVAVLHKATDELSHALSREAMRKARSVARTRSDEEGAQAPGAATPAEPVGLTPKQSARWRWQRMQRHPTQEATNG